MLVSINIIWKVENNGYTDWIRTLEHKRFKSSKYHRRIKGKIMANNYLFVSMILMFFMGGCKDGPIAVPPTIVEEKKWESVPEFNNLDIRYMIHFNNELYAAVVNYLGDTQYKGAVLKTSNGISWSLVKTFDEGVGPMTVEGDSLYVNTDHFIHKMDTRGAWVRKYGIPGEISEAQYNGDMIFINGNLYISQTLSLGYMFKVSPDSVWTRIFPFGPNIENNMSGAKFIKNKKNNIETIYLRTIATSGYIIQFDGDRATYLQKGLPIPLEGANSITIHNDTLLAGFKEVNNKASGMIMYLDENNLWKIYRDSLPNSKSAFNYLPSSTTLPTVILFVKERMFVASDVFGVMEWKSHSGWETLNYGLMLSQGESAEKELYNTISFLEYYQGNLFVGYGNPAYMWGTWLAGPRKGLLKYKLE